MPELGLHHRQPAEHPGREADADRAGGAQLDAVLAADDRGRRADPVDERGEAERHRNGRRREQARPARTRRTTARRATSRPPGGCRVARPRPRSARATRQRDDTLGEHHDVRSHGARLTPRLQVVVRAEHHAEKLDEHQPARRLHLGHGRSRLARSRCGPCAPAGRIRCRSGAARAGGCRDGTGGPARTRRARRPTRTSACAARRAVARWWCHTIARGV